MTISSRHLQWTTPRLRPVSSQTVYSTFKTFTRNNRSKLTAVSQDISPQLITRTKPPCWDVQFLEWLNNVAICSITLYAWTALATCGVYKLKTRTCTALATCGVLKLTMRTCLQWPLDENINYQFVPVQHWSLVINVNYQFVPVQHCPLVEYII